jgi:hypothetical protein
VTTCATDGQQNNCFDVRVCLRFSAEPQDRFRTPLDVEYRLEAERFAGMTIVRVFFKGKREDEYFVTRQLAIQYQDYTCNIETVYVKKSIRDILRSIQFQLTYRLVNQTRPTMNPSQPPLVDLNSYPIISPKSAQPIIQVPFVKNCGSDEICHSQLSLQVTVPNLNRDDSGVYKLLKTRKDTSESTLALDIEVVNSGEDAHDTTVSVTFPSDISFDGSDEQGKLYSCTAFENSVLCTLGNPMPRNQRASFRLTLSPSTDSQTTDDCCSVIVTANTTSNETDRSNDIRVIKLNIEDDADLALYGSSDPKTTNYRRMAVNETYHEPQTLGQIGPEVMHIYEVRNTGSVPMPPCTLEISWPIRLLHTSTPSPYLLYLTAAPLISDHDKYKITCRFNESVINPNGLQEYYQTLKARANGPDQDGSATSPGQPPARQRRSPGGLLDCSSRHVECSKFECSLVESMNPGDSVVLTFPARLWNQTVSQNFADDDQVEISSTARLVFDATESVDQINYKNDVLQVTTTAVLDAEDVEGGPQWWIILIAVLVGLLLLALLIFLLWKLNFFKRNRPAEHQALVQPKKDEKTEQPTDDS